MMNQTSFFTRLRSAIGARLLWTTGAILACHLLTLLTPSARAAEPTTATVPTSTNQLLVVDEPKIAPALPAGKRWNFDKLNDREGWTVPEPLGGAVGAGSLWLKIRNEDPTPYDINQIYPFKQFEIVSPKGLNIPPSTVKKVRLRLANLSPETEGYVRWTTVEKPGVDIGMTRFTMKPYERGWQEVTAHIDGNWGGTIDQIRITPAPMGAYGDIFIDWITICDGPVRPALARPDLKSPSVVPRLTLPGIAQADFQDAFNVLDECLVTDLPCAGFEQPYICPGGAYGFNWWQLDCSLNVAGSKWVNPALAESTIRGFIGVQAQNLDGRIDLWGGSPIRGAVGEISSVPRYFEAAYDVARRTPDRLFAKQIFASMRAYLDWWLSPPKFNATFGLVTGVFEEALGGSGGSQPLTNQMVAPVDLNMAVAVGAWNTAELARLLGYAEDAQKYQAVFDDLRRQINRYMWDEAKGAYYSVDVVARRRTDDLVCSTFDTLRGQVAPPGRVARLVAMLRDPAQFGWGDGVPVRSVARTNPAYVEATGAYDGRAWYGDVWTMRNLPIVCGLEDAGRQDLAGELAWLTIKAFNRKYVEFIKPSDGSGHGVQRYGWSASQYVQAVVEHLFGVDYDRLHNRLRIVPRVPADLAGGNLALEGLILPTRGDTRLSLRIVPEGNGARTIEVTITGDPELDNLEVLQPLPANGIKPRVTDLTTGNELTIADSFDGVQGVVGVRFPMTGAKKTKVRFQPGGPSRGEGVRP
jgi:Trehalase